jgi:hypothetical protein
MIYDTARDPTILCLRVTTPPPTWVLVCAHPVVYQTTCLEVACHCIPLYLPLSGVRPHPARPCNGVQQ